MIRPCLAVALLVAACTAPQPDSLRTVAAYDVPLPTARDRAALLAIMENDARRAGYHLDVATDAELADLSTVSPIRLNAAIWRGDDEEPLVSAIDMIDHVGRAWISFARGTHPAEQRAFQARLMARVRARFPQTATLPVMSSGAIPLAADLIRTPSGYVVKPGARATYERRPD